MKKTMKQLQSEYNTRLLKITIEDYGKDHNLPFHEAVKRLAQERPERFEPWQKGYGQ